MAAGRTAPDNRLNTPCFRFIQQLRPTFKSQLPGIAIQTHSTTPMDAVVLPLPHASSTHKRKEIEGFSGNMLSDSAELLHKICSRVPSYDPPDGVKPGEKIIRFQVTLVTGTNGPFRRKRNRWYYAFGYGSKFSVHRILAGFA